MNVSVLVQSKELNLFKCCTLNINTFNVVLLFRLIQTCYNQMERRNM